MILLSSSVEKPAPGRPQLSALELRTNRACVFSFVSHRHCYDWDGLSSHIFLPCVCVQCDLSVAELINTHSEPLFYDVFMDLGGEEERKLFPLPTLVHNLQYNGQFINQGGGLPVMSVCVGVGALFPCCVCYISTESIKSWYLSRRIFLVDSLSGREKSISSVPKVIRVATSIKIRWVGMSLLFKIPVI